MKKLALLVLFLAVAVPAHAQDMAATLNAILLKASSEGHWQVKAADVAKMIAEKKTDFLVVDVRPVPPGQKGGKIPGSIFISYNEILKPENLKKLPKDKKIILVCVTGQTQNLPVLALRALGYDARTMSFGMSAWAKGYFGGTLMTGAINEANYPVE
ncbi:MAG: rhodanese-like domain-containing protein [Thermodesulfovibrionales bacterium]|nr:rhodanese-like domain-containing protein [Thermodesulfovibrionales bacterium]